MFRTLQIRNYQLQHSAHFPSLYQRLVTESIFQKLVPCRIRPKLLFHIH
ncbi:hypothetical protein [Staphylococcus phage PT1-1]